MNVLQVNKFYHPTVGGVERVVQDIAEGLAGPHEMRVLACTERGTGSRFRRQGVAVRKAPSLGVLLSVPLAPSFPLELRRAASDADLIHHHLPDPLGVSAQELTRPDVPMIATYHSDIVRQERIERLYRPVLRRFLDRANRIIVTSPQLLTHSEVLAPFRDKCQVIPPSVAIDSFPDPTDYRRTTATETPTLLFVGRLIYYKGVEYLIDAVAAADSDPRLVICGDGPRRGALEERAVERGLAGRVEFRGYVPDEELHSAYQQADCFVLPSVARSEAFGIVQLEAMAHGLPVINTALDTGVPWVSIDGETGLTVSPADPDALADAIDTLVLNDERRLSYGQAARCRVETQFDQKTMLRRYRALYRTVNTHA